ncbi:hypothetical protein IAR50_003195 [Cryptococcus sp. DSM 104548]
MAISPTAPPSANERSSSDHTPTACSSTPFTSLTEPSWRHKNSQLSKFMSGGGQVEMLLKQNPFSHSDPTFHTTSLASAIPTSVTHSLIQTPLAMYSPMYSTLSQKPSSKRLAATTKRPSLRQVPYNLDASPRKKSGVPLQRSAVDMRAAQSGDGRTLVSPSASWKAKISSLSGVQRSGIRHASSMINLGVSFPFQRKAFPAPSTANPHSQPEKTTNQPGGSKALNDDRPYRSSMHFGVPNALQPSLLPPPPLKEVDCPSPTQLRMASAIERKPSLWGRRQNGSAKEGAKKVLRTAASVPVLPREVHTAPAQPLPPLTANPLLRSNGTISTTSHSPHPSISSPPLQPIPSAEPLPPIPPLAISPIIRNALIHFYKEHRITANVQNSIPHLLSKTRSSQSSCNDVRQ